MAEWKQAAKARNDFADMLAGLTKEQLKAQSLCGQWDARGVLAHLTGFVEISGAGFFATMIKSGFNFDKVSVSIVNKRSDRSVADLLQSLRSNATKSAFLPGFPEAMTVADVAIHTQDVRRPLGLAGAVDDTVLSTALDFLTTHKRATQLVKRRPIDGVRLQATDRDWSYGSGAEISGTGEAIMMGLANRPVLDDLTGEGLSRWK